MDEWSLPLLGIAVLSAFVIIAVGIATEPDEAGRETAEKDEWRRR